MKNKSGIQDLFDRKSATRLVANLVKDVTKSLPKIHSHHGLPTDGQSLKVAQYWQAFKEGHWVPERYRKQFARKRVEMIRDQKRIDAVLKGDINLANAEESRKKHNPPLVQSHPKQVQDTLQIKALAMAKKLRHD